MVTIEDVREAVAGSLLVTSCGSFFEVPEKGILRDEKGREFVPGNRQKAYIQVNHNKEAYIWLFAPISQELIIKEIISPEEWQKRKEKREPTRE